jgi:spermidine synthase
VAWQRILALHSGVGIYSVAMIVAAFMAGLGLGSHVGGTWSARLDRRAALGAFALVELAVGAFGAVSCRIYYDILYLKGSWLYASPWSAGLMHFLALVAPTTLMGMSLPLLVRGMVRDADSAGRTIGTLYGFNLLGAAAGALVTPWVLIRYFGLDGAVMAAAIGNAVVGLVGLALRRRLAREVSASGEGAEEAGRSGAGELDRPALTDAATTPFSHWLALYATSGFCALSLEILWFRVVDVAVRSTAFTFGTILGTYLLGMGAGCLWAAHRADHLARPLRTFLLCQSSLLAYSAVVLILVAALPPATPLYSWYFAFWSDIRRDVLGFGISPERLLKLYVLVPVLLFGVPTVLMGYSFPVLQRAIQDDAASSGRKVGLLQAANIAGCTAGSLVVGLGLLSWIGSTGSLRVLLLIGAGMALVGVRAYGRRSVLSAAAVVLVLLACAVPGQRRFWLPLHGVIRGPALLAEDATGVSGLVPSENTWRVHVNGKVHSWLPFGGIHSTFGAVPAIVHGSPQDVAIIGLGSGDTAWAAACRRETRALTVFEIARPLPRLLGELAAREPLPDLRAFLADPRLRLVISDGRNALERDQVLYDFIQADPLWPEVAYSGNLYSREFYAHCAARLKPGGFMCAWMPTARSRATFSSVFPHVLLAGQIAIGSLQAIPVQHRRWRQRLEDPAVASYLGPERAQDVLLTLQALRPAVRLGLAPNRDLYPRDEFAAP